MGSNGGGLILGLLGLAAVACGALPLMGAITAVAEGDNGGLLIIPFVGVCLFLVILLVMRALPAMSDAEFIRQQEIADAEHEARLREIERR